jgi:hypothetical protein
MWRTSEAERTLEGPEAELFRFGVLKLGKEIDDDANNWGTYFSRMTRNERLTALARVAKALLEPSARCPALRAWNEDPLAAAAPVSRQIRRRGYDTLNNDGRISSPSYPP